MLKPVILIGGPTASGKSALAMQIARQVQGSIINADALQIYAGLPVLTAQPDAEDRAEIPHLLYETVDAGEAWSVGKWLTRAETAIAEARAAGRTPVVVGGTGLYFTTLTKGLAAIPDIPPAIRAAAETLYAGQGEAAFRLQLSQIDPDSAGRIARNDRQRLIRAWEVVTHTGLALKGWHQKQKTEKTINAFDYRLLMPARDELYARCDRRFLTMLDQGAIEEVKRLMARGLSPSLPAMKIIGVREIAAYLNGEITLNAATARAQQMTRNYAKRQMTWFRNQWRDYTVGE